MGTLKQRMYFFVPYNISPIQQAIQAGHAALEYAWKYPITPEYIDFMKNDKTWIILNGGTTNNSLDENGKPLGTLNILHAELWAANVGHSLFYEPDLNNALTAICFLADERVWDYETYPDFKDYLDSIPLIYVESSFKSIKMFKNEELIEMFPSEYEVWKHKLGGEKNVFLRNLLKGKKLA